MIRSKSTQPLDDVMHKIKSAKSIAEFDMGVELKSVQMIKNASVGDTIKGKLTFELADEWGDKEDIKLFVHGIVPGGKLRVAGKDQFFLQKSVHLKSALEGDLIEEHFTFNIPKNISADLLDVRIGFYKGKQRFKVSSGQNDGENRVSIGLLKIADAPKTFSKVIAKLTDEDFEVDGHLNEKFWKTAQRIGPFISYNGVSRVKNKTFARLAYSKDALYLAIEAEDDDIHSPYLKRDDPLYNSEAVEIFIDANSDKDDYIELQCSPNNLHFDASFKGGARKNFNTKFNANYSTAVSLEGGTFNQNSDKDSRWITEWRIPYTEIIDLKAAPKHGDRWRINLFRLDRPRKGKKVVGNEATAWSSPYSGDFHNLERFGTLFFEK